MKRYGRLCRGLLLLLAVMLTLPAVWTAADSVHTDASHRITALRAPDDTEEGDAPAFWTTSIAVKTMPEKTNYRVGNTFDPSGMVVIAHQQSADGTKEDVELPASFLICSPTKLSKSGNQSIQIRADLNDKKGNKQSFYATITVSVFEKIKITKSPKGEKVKEGGACNFTARAGSYRTIEWMFVKGGEEVRAEDAEKTFAGLTLKGVNEEKLQLSTIPYSLNGWSVYCVFSTPAESRATDKASIKVTANPSARPTEAPTEKPTAAPESDQPTETPELTLAPTDTPAPTETPHVHSFAGDYHFDEKQHWLECACGERANVADHIVTEWRETQPATRDAEGTRTGTCVVCSAIVTENVPYTGSNTRMWTLLGIGGAVALTVPPLMIAGTILRRKEKEKTRNQKNRGLKGKEKPEQEPPAKPLAEPEPESAQEPEPETETLTTEPRAPENPESES